ncbi:MAG: serine/threonine protein kinase [Planctomycetota bacterium]|nr:MAG: serine/threonine protein kinase [Planctomycetota bacterium]
MSARLRWQTDSAEGVFPLLRGPLHLVWSESGLDRVSQPPVHGAAITAQPPDAEGRVELEARGELEFLSGDKRFRKVRLPLGRSVAFRSGEHGGLLEAQGDLAASDPLLGKTLGQYQVREKLGAGAVGTVYRALQTSLEREVALKVLDAQAAADAVKVASFQREAVAAGKLVHPNVVQVYDVGQDAGLHFYSMELVHGGSLEDRLRRNGPLPWQEALAAVRECALALAFAEERRLLHRDVKPANLMLAESGHVKLADLGLAATRGMMDAEAAGGTPHFMAPEAVGGADVDQRADLYSLGCTLYRLCTAKTPFQGASVKEILRAHRDLPPPSLRGSGVAVPAAVDELLARLLAKDPNQRPEHAAEVAAACDAVLRGGGSRRLAPVLGLLLLAAGGVLVWQLTREPELVEPETVVQYVPDPGAADAQARLAATERERAYYQAMAAPEERRVDALLAFLQRHPDGALAAQAQAEIERLRAAASAPLQAAAGVPPADAALSAGVDGLLAERRYGAARAALEAGVAASEATRAALAERIAAAAVTQFRAWEDAHAQALRDGAWDQAAALRADFERGLAGEATPPEWETRLDQLAAAAGEAQTRAAEAAFHAARLAFLQHLHVQVQPALRQLDLETAAEQYAQAVAGCAHAALAEAAAAENDVFAAAARAQREFRTRVASGEELAIVEPAGGKRAVVLGLEPPGLRLLVQVRGERSERVDPWSDYVHPETLSGLLRAVLPAELDDEAACALYLLLGEERLAAQLRSFAARAPGPAEGAALAAEARAWLERLPRSLSQEPAWLPRHQQAVSQLAAVGDALAEPDEYLALLRLEQLLSRYSLLAAMASDGSSAWGLQP